MKKTFITLSLFSFSLVGYSQNHLKQNPPTVPMTLDFLKNNQSEVLKSQIMTDYLKNYQDKNSVKTIDLPVLGMNAVKEKAKNLENIDNMIIVKPNLAAMIKMPVVKPNEDIYYHSKIINSDTNKVKPLN